MTDSLITKEDIDEIIRIPNKSNLQHSQDVHQFYGQFLHFFGVLDRERPVINLVWKLRFSEKNYIQDELNSFFHHNDYTFGVIQGESKYHKKNKKWYFGLSYHPNYEIIPHQLKGTITDLSRESTRKMIIQDLTGLIYLVELIGDELHKLLFYPEIRLNIFCDSPRFNMELHKSGSWSRDFKFETFPNV